MEDLLIFRLSVALVLVPILCTAKQSSLNSTSSPNSTSSFHVGVILDLDSPVGSIGLSCLSMALSDFYSVHNNYTTKLTLHVRDSKGQVIDSAASGLDLLKDVHVDAIIGPQKSSQANFLINLGDRAHVPIISFSATSPSLRPQTPYFVQTTPSDETQVGAIAAIVKGFRWSQVVIIYEDSDFGNGIVPYLSNAFQDINARVSYRCVIPVSATDDFILVELYKMMTMQTRVFVAHLSHSLGERLFVNAKKIGMMSDGYAWIVTSGMMNLLNSMDFHVVEAMHGVLGVKPLVPQTQKLASFTRKWKRKFLLDNPDIERAELSIFGLWAYDTLFALAMAIERVGIQRAKSLDNVTAFNSADIFTLGISETGPELLKAILDTKLEGLSGEFDLVNGQLAVSSFQILNVVGKGENEVGIWTPSLGISRELNVNVDPSSHSVSKGNLKSIVWPGDSTTVPKGWEVPVGGKKLRVGVPVKSGFTTFVKVVKDPQSNVTRVSGHYIEIFKSVIAALPYAVPYEFVPFQKLDGSSAGSYNDLVYQVFLQNYDVVVGDVTITANRSTYVDFTLPFAEGGIISIVLITYEDVNDNWAFLKPLDKELWLTSIAFFIYTGLAIWILEHRVNTAFRGPPSEHVGKILYFAFMTLVFANREKIVTNLARLVLVVWVFVVLILSSTYTASLSSRLTVQKLQPTVTGVKELIKNGDYVGCQEGSFILDFLKGKGFEESKIRPCRSPENCDEALSRGSKNGGISAFFDVTPYIKDFLSQYCNKYMIVGPTYRTDGFAYVLPKGSPLLADISRAIIELTENGKILELDQQLFKNPNCDKPEGTNPPTSVPLRSFQRLFAITGGVTGSCLIVFFVTYLSRNKDFLQSISNTSATIWSRTGAMFRHSNQKDYPSSSFSEGTNIHDQFSSHLDESPNLPRNNSSNVVIPISSPEMELATDTTDPNAADTDQSRQYDQPKD